MEPIDFKYFIEEKCKIPTKVRLSLSQSAVFVSLLVSLAGSALTIKNNRLFWSIYAT